MRMINVVLEKRIAELEAERDEWIRATERSGRRVNELKAENERLRRALKRIAPTACPKCGDRAIQQIARDALMEGNEEDYANP